MALDQSALLEVLEVLKVADVGDRVRQAAETVYQPLIEAELTDTIGAALHERTDTRTNLRNGHRTRMLSTTAGDWSCGRQATRSVRRSSSPRGHRGWILTTSIPASAMTASNDAAN
jgi:Transposase, Mutator family